MTRQDYEELGMAERGLQSDFRSSRGLFTTTGRGLRGGKRAADTRFIVVSD